MAIFDSNKVVYLPLYVVLTDPAAVAAAQAAHPDGYVVAPYNPGPPAGGAAIEFSAPFRGYTQPAASEAPFTWTTASPEAAQDAPYPLNVATFQRHTGGFLGMGGTTVRYYWLAQFVLAADENNDTPALVAAQAEIPARRFIEGFETPGIATIIGFTSSGGITFSRDASRHIGGMGLAIRGTAQTASAAMNQFGGANPTSGWERFYLRLRKLPAATVFFWKIDLFPSAGEGIVLGLTATGQLAIYSSDASAVRTLVTVIATPVLEVWNGRVDHQVWKKIDILYNVFNAVSGNTGTFRLYIAGALAYSGNMKGGPTITHSGSKFGNVAATANELYLDVDDWINSAIPLRNGVEALTGKDWINGSKVALVRPSAFSANHSASWLGDFRVLQQNVITGQTLPETLTTSTSGVLAAVDTDAVSVLNADPGSLGAVAMIVAMWSKRGTTSGTLGYSVGGGAAVMAAATQQVVNAANAVIYTIATATAVGAEPTIPTMTPIELRHAKGADVGAATLSSLLAQVEMVGKFGPEDYRAAELTDITDPTPVGTGTHNAPYPRSPWALTSLAPPPAPYIVKGGTYVGNGTGQDLTFRSPVHWLYIRPLTGGAGGYFWLSPMLGSHKSYQQGVTPQVVNADEDPTFVEAPGDDSQQQRYRIRIAGSNSQINQNAITYQYIAISDPGMRWMLNGILAQGAAVANQDNPLVSANFLPGFGFFFTEDAGATATVRLYAKSAGQAAATIVSFQPGTVVNALTFGTGTLATQANMHTLGGGSGQAYSLWRRSDGNQDSNEAAVVCYGTYTGDGSASRTITFAPATGKRPLMAMVFAESGTAALRDPSCTGTISVSSTGADIASTGITAGGIDQMTVGSALNASGVVYAYFVQFADATACNNGWGCNGEYAPPEMYPPAPGGPWPAPPDSPPEDTPPDTDPDPGTTPDPDDGSPDFDVECEPATRGIVNRALARIGVNKQTVNLSTDVSIEKSMAVLNWGADVNQVLRDFPWPFATKYSVLVRVAGTTVAPVNTDWRYSYRVPTDCVFERRLVPTRGTAVDPTPPPFQLTRDVAGGLILCNETAPTLEYTHRVTCPASTGDALFREALTWRHAATLAASLSRDKEKATYCLEQYRASIKHAEDVLRPGIPGLDDVTTPVDADAARKLAVVNRALIRIGARTIGSYLRSDQSREANAARLIFDMELDATLRDHPWAFATTYADLVLVGGTPASPVNDDWTYSYRVPSAALYVRRMVREGTGRQWDLNPATYRLAGDATGGLLYTDETPATIEYTARVSLSFADPLFLDALAWRLAASLAPALAQVDPEVPEQLGRGPDPNSHTAPEWRAPQRGQQLQVRQRIAANAWQMYGMVLRIAKAANANEQKQNPDGDVDWILGRE